MATATLKANLIEDICTKRIEALEAKYEADTAAWKENKSRQLKWRGRWPWRHSYYPTQAEVDEDFVTGVGWFGSAQYWLQQDHARLQNPLVDILTVAQESIERGDGRITLNEGEIHAVRMANLANGGTANSELEDA